MRMPSYFILWKLNPNIPPPPDPKAQVQQFEGFHALMKSQLESGVMKEIHSFLQVDAGYAVIGDLPDEKVLEALEAWSPFVTFEVHRTIPTLRSVEISLNRVKKLAGT